MAVIFNKELNISKLNLVFNNNVVEFYSDNIVPPAKADISVGGRTVTIYPDPNGVFRYNFKELMIAITNVDNYADDLDVNIDNDYTYDWTDKIYLDSTVLTTIHLANDTTETDSRNIIWLSAYVNLQEWKQTYPALSLLTNGIDLLQPDNGDAYHNYKVPYWNGYPFDITLFNKSKSINITNNTNGLDYDFDTDEFDITRLVFSDGNTNETIEDVLPLSSGYNDLVVSAGLINFNIELFKNTIKCANGVYIKWINQFGGWNYWLFSKGQEFKKTNNRGSLFNDTNNLEDTTSPYVSLGKESNNSIRVKEQRVSENYKELLNGLIDSAKVYFFTGTPFSQNNFNDWLEVEVKTGTFKTENSRGDMFTFDFEFGLPNNVTRSL